MALLSLPTSQILIFSLLCKCLSRFLTEEDGLWRQNTKPNCITSLCKHLYFVKLIILQTKTIIFITSIAICWSLHSERNNCSFKEHVKQQCIDLGSCSKSLLVFGLKDQGLLRITIILLLL